MIIFDTRNELLKHYSNEIEKPKILELGVFKGEFLEFLEKEIDYDCIDGVDIFDGIHGSGDCDGNHSVTTNMREQYLLLRDKYKDNPNVNLHKSLTHIFLETIPDNTYDIIYIDADHQYNAVKRDIELSFKKIKNGGFIMGHDYELNKDKCNHNWQFGTKKAVDEFCEINKQEIIAKGNDGCVSFCIKINK
tara:strand:- start:94 stop:666 length:573 start_codon:yes stop_codon:yes gene_type:complete